MDTLKEVAEAEAKAETESTLAAAGFLSFMSFMNASTAAGAPSASDRDRRELDGVGDHIPVRAIRPNGDRSG